MSFENPGFESFENKEKTKEQVIEEISKHLEKNEYINNELNPINNEFIF